MLTEMGNHIDDKPSMMESLHDDSLISSSDHKDKLHKIMENVEMEVNRVVDMVNDRNSDKESYSNDITPDCIMVQEDQYLDGGYDERQFTGKSDSEQEESNKSNKENIEETHNSSKFLLKSYGFKKKSKKQKKEERMKIHSETHRLMREREISIPYHIPKQRTLREFLSRKKNRANIPLNTPSSKMFEIWKDIEESTKNAFEFFKSDSDSDGDSCNNNDKQEKTEENEDKINRLNIYENGRCFGNVTDKEISNLDLAENTFASEKINDDKIPVLNNDDNHIFICENAVIEPDDLVKGDEKCLKDRQEAEDSKGPGVICNENSDLDLTNNVQKEVTIFAVNDSTQEKEDHLARERTCEWVKNIPLYENMLARNKREILLQKLNPKLLEITPKLSGTPDSIIDLENDKNSIEIGAKNLKKRFLQNCFVPRNKPGTEVELTITTSEKNEKGEISSVATEKLLYSSPGVLNDLDLDKPGAKLQRLREELKKKIEAKWEEGNRKKMEEMVNEKNKKLTEEEVEDEEELIDDEEIEESDESSEESEPEEDDIPLTDKKTKKNRYIDSEAEESDCMEEESGNEGGDELDDESDEDEGEDDEVASRDETEKQEPSLEKEVFTGNDCNDSQSSLIPPYQPGGGMLHGGSELTQTDGDMSLPNNVLSPALQLSLDLSPSIKNGYSQQQWDIDLDSPEESNTKSSFVPCFPENKNFDLTDAYEFCSGKFPGEGDTCQDTRCDVTNSQHFVSSVCNESQPNSNIFDSLLNKNDATGGDEGNGEKMKKRSRLIILSDDSDEEEEMPLDDLNELEDITDRRESLQDSDDPSEASLPAKNRGTRKNLVLSDDEDDSETERKVTRESEESEEENSSQNEEDPFADEANREVVYDSEENEIVNPKEYFEREAELSGSEWSGDEDERGMDEFEEEDGDNEKLDEKKIRSELEKIHMRTLLDDDERQVRQLQELLFEDGDLFDDGPKREKNFRWKDLGSFFDDDVNDDNDPERAHGQEDMEEDEQSRQSRHEKELFLLQMKSKREELDLDDDDECGISFMKRGKVVIESSSRAAKITKTPRTDVDEFGVKTPFAITNKRGSFLSRNEEFLLRLAKFTANTTDNIHGPKHSKNFVFAAKSPEKEFPSIKENSLPKRKNSLPRGDQPRNKRPKLDKASSGGKTSILDRLT